MASPIDSMQYASFLAKHFRKQDVQPLIVAILLELGIKDVGNELQTLKHAVPMYFKSPSSAFTKEIYPAVGMLVEPQMDGLGVERKMRYAIKEAWKTRDREVWSRYLPGSPCDGRKAPSNSEFISRIAGFLEIWQSCYEVDADV